MQDSKVKDETMPLGKWDFDNNVTQVFDNMLERSIPQYETMRDACYQLASRYVRTNTAIVDLGCSRGEALRKLVDKFGDKCRYIGIDVSEPMLEAAKQNFLSVKAPIEFYNMDLRTNFPHAHASVVLSVLTLQFVPIEYRQQILDNIYSSLLPGGALIIVEKLLGATGHLDKHMVDIYYGLKRSNGYTQEQIDRKRLSLEGVLVPLTAKMNEDLLKSAGFKEIDNFWRWMNFAGWVAVK